jgi:hypothetical protein
MHREPRFSTLSALRQDLLRLCQSTNYGEINNLPVCENEPVLPDPRCFVLVDIKLDSEECSRHGADQSDFLLSAEVVRLMALARQDSERQNIQNRNSRGNPSQGPLGAKCGGRRRFDMIFACRKAGRI